MRIVTVIVTALLTAATVQARISGTWSGKLHVSPQAELELVMNLGTDGRATLDSPDQNAFGIPMDVSWNQDDSLAVAVAPIGMKFEGRLDNGELRGTFRQGLARIPLSLTRRDTAVGHSRPQTPQPPFPYTETEVTFDGAGGAHLAGTLAVPDTPAAGSPAVVMISGSGAQDRDETVAAHRPFAVIADHLARHGIASLRYDDRGTGGSTGPTDTLTTAGNIADARKAIAWMRSRESFGRIGVLGHSEGGRIAFALPVDFIVAIGAPAVRGDTLLADQNRALLMVNGTDDETAAMYADAFLKVVNGTDPAVAVAGWEMTPLRRQLADNLHKVVQSRTPWLDYMLKDDPTADIAGCRMPVMTVYGAKDQQVSAALNAPRIRSLLPDATVMVADGLNHMMQHCTTGNVTEYGQIEETVAPEVLEAITNWITGLR